MNINNIATETAHRFCEQYNPYRDRAERRVVNGLNIVVYDYNGLLYTEQELDASYCKTFKSDFIHGYSDRMAGYYDKWYRYNHADEGRAYDEGVKLATQQTSCKEEMIIIPCMH